MSDDILKRMANDLNNAKGKAKPMPKGKSDYPLGGTQKPKKPNP